MKREIEIWSSFAVGMLSLVLLPWMLLEIGPVFMLTMSVLAGGNLVIATGHTEIFKRGIFWTLVYAVAFIEGVIEGYRAGKREYAGFKKAAEKLEARKPTR